MRTIVVKGKTYRYRVGRAATDVRRDDNTCVGKPWNHELNGRSYYDYERGLHKRTSDCIVTPEHVASYIVKEEAHAG